MLEHLDTVKNTFKQSMKIIIRLRQIRDGNLTISSLDFGEVLIISIFQCNSFFNPSSKGGCSEGLKILDFIQPYSLLVNGGCFNRNFYLKCDAAYEMFFSCISDNFATKLMVLYTYTLSKTTKTVLYF